MLQIELVHYDHFTIIIFLNPVEPKMHGILIKN